MPSTSIRTMRCVTLVVASAMASCASSDPWDDIERGRGVENRTASATTFPVEESPARDVVFTASAPLLAPRSGNPVLLRVGPVDVYASELTDAFFFFAHAQTSEILRKLVEEHLVRLEAKRLGVEVSQESVERGVRDYMQRFERELRETLGTEFDVEVYLRDELLTDRAAYEARIRRYVALGGLRDRVIRYAGARALRYEVRVITTATPEAAERALKDIEQGADFSVLHATLVPAGAGPAEGRWPLLPAHYEHPIVDAVSKLVGPGLAPIVREARNGGSIWHVVELLAIHPASERPFAELAGGIREELERRPVTRDEYLLWLLDVRTRYPVERLRP